MTEFQLDFDADISDTSYVDEVEVAPADVMRAFGPPLPADEYKVSGRYSFVGGGRVFTLYDWKSTSLYDQELPSPLAFWEAKDARPFSIGSDGEEPGEFKPWLLRTLNDLRPLRDRS